MPKADALLGECDVFKINQIRIALAVSTILLISACSNDPTKTSNTVGSQFLELPEKSDLVKISDNMIDLKNIRLVGDIRRASISEAVEGKPMDVIDVNCSKGTIFLYQNLMAATKSEMIVANSTGWASIYNAICKQPINTGTPINRTENTKLVNPK
jgi:PBP1b-binding outer membrane lipoprotein LpoB